MVGVDPYPRGVSDPVVMDAPPSPRPTLGHVGALDGIRALAVAAVVLYHGGVTAVRGGFLGVDVFFVLSGFLITSLLLRELERGGRLRFGRFYERRARRLLPALVVLVVLVALYASLAVPGGSEPSLPGQIVGTMAYVGNWTLITAHATYFTQGLPPSPLQHTWSLAIEEQFYLVWPALLVGLRVLTRRRAPLGATCIAGSIACAAFTALRYEQGASVNALYFATQTHATTMLLGAALACAVLTPSTATDATSAAAFRHAPPAWRRVCGAGGVVAWLLVIVAMLTVAGTGSALYRGGYVAFGAVVAAAIGATVAVPDGLAARLLSLRPVAFIGRISYGIYLYHFPLFLWLDHAHTGLRGPALLALRLASTLAIATASYVAIEQPVRERRLLRGVRGLVTAAGAYVLVGALAVSATAAAATIPFGDEIARWNPVRATPAAATTTVLLVGDSMAQTLGGGLNNPFMAAAHVFVTVNANPRCSLVGGRMRVKDFRFDSPRRCNARSPRGWPTRWARTVLHRRPALSMMLFRLDVVDHRLAGRWQHIGDPQYDCTLSSRLLRLAAVLAVTGRPVVFLTSPYYDTGEQPNGAPWVEDDPARVRGYNQLLERVAAQFPEVIHLVDLGAMLSPEGRYTRTIGATVVRWVDGVHLTYGGDSYLVPRLLPIIERLAGTTPTRGALTELALAAGRAATRGCPTQERAPVAVG
jgi:peptidoglycan/LPS O-acetylase OafA/YrhL